MLPSASPRSSRSFSPPATIKLLAAELTASYNFTMIRIVQGRDGNQFDYDDTHLGGRLIPAKVGCSRACTSQVG